MQFQTAAQRKCYEKIAPWVRALFGDRVRVRDDVPLIDVTVGSALTQVGVFPSGRKEALVITRSYLVARTQLSEDLLRFLLEQNAARERFGAFGIDTDGQILFQHAIVGSTCDKAELQASVLSVARAADRFDDEIVNRWGGEHVLS